MRRWIFAVLALLNLGLLLWGVQYLEPERPARTEAPDEVNPERMKLLSELPPNKLVARPKPPPPPPPVAIADGQLCYRVGPIAEAEQLKKIETALGAQQLPFTKREETARAVAGYRVFLPSFASRDEAERRRRELTRAGFRDHALMHDDGFQNAISLGLFSVEANARAHLQRLAEKKIKAEMQTVEQTRTVHWLEVTPAENTTGVLDRLKSMLEGVVGAGVGEMPCPAPVVPASPPAELPDTG